MIAASHSGATGLTMLYVFPADTFVVAIRDYAKPYDDPISVGRGDVVQRRADGAITTDVVGWTWCTAADGRSGWTPDAWCERVGGGWRLIRDFSAFELTVKIDERLRAHFSESGFLWCEAADGDRGWVPDGAVALSGGAGPAGPGEPA